MVMWCLVEVLVAVLLLLLLHGVDFPHLGLLELEQLFGGDHCGQGLAWLLLRLLLLLLLLVLQLLLLVI